MKKTYIVLLIFLFTLVSCGGGGGGSDATPTNPTGSSTPTPTPTPTPAPSPAPTPTPSPAPSSSLPVSGAINLTNEFEQDKITYENSAEYIEQAGLALINASSAYARGATGQGALIGIMDSGVDDSHQELDGMNKLTSDSYLVYSDRSPTTEEKRHGTHVSAIALGERDGSGMHGVAFDAQLFFISIKLGTAGEDYEPAQIDSTVDYTGVDDSWSQLVNYFVERGVTVVNGSFGYQGNINDYTEENLRYAFPKTIEVLAQAGTPDADKTLFIWSAGNGGGYADQGVDYSSPEVFGGLPYLVSELRNNSAAVVSVDANGEISSFSNRCGVAKDYCIAAPGRSITSAYAQDAPDYNYYAEYSGTSMAAPHVSGGLALLVDYFDGQLGNTEILQRLFLTADKSGIYADADIYGQGLMDLDEATKPQGTTMIATFGDAITNLTLTEGATKIFSLGPAFGGGIGDFMQNAKLIVIDELGAPFSKELGSKSFSNLYSPNWLASNQSFIKRKLKRREINTSQGSRLTLGINERLSFEEYGLSLWADNEKSLNYFSLLHPISRNNLLFVGKGYSPNLYFGNESEATFTQNKSLGYYGSPYLDLAYNGSFLGYRNLVSSKNEITLALFSGTHRENNNYLIKSKGSTGLIAEYRSRYDKTSISFQGGVTNEAESLLGSSLSGAFGLKSSKTYFGGIELMRLNGAIETKGSIFIGKSNPSFENKSLITSMDNLISTSLNIGIYKRGFLRANDYFGFRIDQPLKVEESGVELLLPYRRNKNKEIQFETMDFDLSPKYRELNSEFIYELSTNRLDFFGRMGLSRNQGHQESDLEPYFMIDMELRID